MRKKQIEAQAQKLYSQRYTVEQQLMNLEATEDDAAVLETLSVATSANKNYMADSDTIESTLSDIAEQQEQMDKISKMFEIQASEQDDLLQELEKLTLADEAASEKLLIQAQKDKLREEALEFARLDDELAQFRIQYDTQAAKYEETKER